MRRTFSASSRLVKYMLCDPNELVDKGFLVTCVPASQSSVKTIKEKTSFHPHCDKYMLMLIKVDV